LILILANLFFLAWQFWVEPAPLAPPPAEPSGLVLFRPDAGRTAGKPQASQTRSPGRPERWTPSAGLGGGCFRLGPLASTAAAQQAGERLAVRGIQATPIARDTQVWLGHWVQIAGFASAQDAEAARQRLVAGGLADAYLMQDGAQPMLSLGVFRDRNRADRVASLARSLGFQVAMRDRYRPTVEQWLLISPRPDQTLGPADLSLAGDRIMRSEVVPCEEAVSPSESVAELPATGQPN
jgi:hypothetical protein